MTWRDRALVALGGQGVEPRHAQSHIVQRHGHGPLCCCMMKFCRSDECNVNAKIIELMAAAAE